MKTIMKKFLCFLIVFFILFSFCCYAVETLTAQQKEAEEWYIKGYNADTLTLKVEYYTKAIELDSKYANAYSNRGGAFANLGESQKAIDDCTKAIELDPKFANTFSNRGGVYVILGEYQKAMDDCTKAIELDPKLANAYGNRGVAYGFQGVPTAACDDFYQAGILFLEQNSTTQALICVDYMKIVDPLTSLINKLMDQIYP